ncbi:hypothetical protein [Sulfurimonas sp.]|uniref:hypothetical protein n=1 Tax=Sulfurimonas sp. TaxID=2022749 RepID=UPI00261AF8EC|nr:hypothetical protein [Sulfurimonas sp.]
MFLYRAIFFIVLLAVLLIKDTALLLTVLMVLWIVYYRDFVVLNVKVVKSILFFNLSVTIGYLVMSFLKGFNPTAYLLYINLKVYTITFFVFSFFSKINIVHFFAFSKDLSYLLTISLSQIISYKKSFEEFKLAYKARIVKHLQSRDKAFIIRVFDQFLQKSLKESKERTLAMKSRGFFD